MEMNFRQYIMQFIYLIFSSSVTVQYYVLKIFLRVWNKSGALCVIVQYERFACRQHSINVSFLNPFLPLSPLPAPPRPAPSLSRFLCDTLVFNMIIWWIRQFDEINLISQIILGLDNIIMVISNRTRRKFQIVTICVPYLSLVWCIA